MNIPPPLRLIHAGLPILIALLIAAFGLRLWSLDKPSVWHDEAWSIRAIRDPINTPDDNTPPAYYSLMHILWQGSGDSAFALRYGSVLLDLVTITLAAQLVRRWVGWDPAILTAIFFGVSPLLWAYAREIRAYVAVPLLTVLLLWLTDDLLKRHVRFPWRVWVGVLITELVLLYTHNLSVPVVGWLNLVVFGVWAYQRQWKFLGIWIVGQAALLFAYLPWLLGQSASGTSLNTPPALDFSLVWKIWQAYFAPLPTQIGEERPLVIGSIILAMVAALSLAVILSWNRSRRTLLLLSQVILLPVLATLELHAAHIDFHPRYYIAAVPATLILIALGIDSLPDEFEMRRIAIPSSIALVCGVGAASLIGLLDDPKYQHDDFRAIAEYYAGLPEDAIILIPYGWEPALEEYYVGKVGIRAEILGIELHSNTESAITEINAALKQRKGPVHVELLTWYQLPADIRGMYPCLLESAGQRVGNVLTVQGITTTGYTVERSVTLTDVPDLTSNYGWINLVGAAFSGREAICLRTTWEVEQVSQADWRVAGRILTTDPPGWVIARSDTDIRAADQAPTSEWKAGQRGAGFSLLRLPTGAPPEHYVVEASIYSKAESLARLVNGVPAGQATKVTTIRLAGVTSRADNLPSHTLEPVALAQDVQLVGHDAKGGKLSPGQELRITLEWQVPEDCCQETVWTEGSLVLRGAGWELVQPVTAYPVYSLDWHSFVIPPDASGRAVLTVQSAPAGSITLATYTIEKTDRLFVPPPFDTAVQVTFGDLGVLEGFSVDRTIVSPDENLELTLVWRAVGASEVSYRVFTHLLDTNGQVIAQHDGYPLDETRPTTGWVAHEYLVDRHVLTFVPEALEYQGMAHLEIGFYDPETNQRVTLSNGADHLILPVEITVQ